MGPKEAMIMVLTEKKMEAKTRRVVPPEAAAIGISLTAMLVGFGLALLSLRRKR